MYNDFCQVKLKSCLKQQKITLIYKVIFVDSNR